jgi:hypothetical protein
MQTHAENSLCGEWSMASSNKDAFRHTVTDPACDIGMPQNIRSSSFAGLFFLYNLADAHRQFGLILEGPKKPPVKGQGLDSGDSDETVSQPSDSGSQDSGQFDRGHIQEIVV